MKKEINQIKIGSILSYAQMFLSVAIGILYTPVMIRLLGKSEYGLYNTVASTISMLSILTLGFNSSYVRYYAKYKKEGKVESIYKLNGLFIIIFMIIGIIALACGLFLSFNLTLVFDEGLTAEEYNIAKILMLLMTVNLSVSFPMSVFTSIISANEKYVFLKLLGMLKTVLGPLITLPILLAGYRSIAMVTVSLVVNVFTDTVFLFYVKIVLKNKFIFHGFEKGLFKSLFVYTIFIALNLIVDQVNSNMGKLLLGRFKGTDVVAVYSVGYSLYQYYMMFSTSISSIFTPRIHALIQETVNDREKRRQVLTELFVKVGRIQFIILGLVATGLIFFGKRFIYFWAGEGYEEAYYVMLLIIIPSSIALIQNSGIEIQRAQNKHQFRSIVYSAMAIINVIVTVLFCQRYGAVGAAIGTAVSLIIGNGIIMNFYYHFKCDINIVAFWKSILRLSLGLIIPCVVGVFILKYTNMETIFNMLVYIALYSCVYCASMWVLGINSYEKDLIRKPIKAIFKKI